MRAKYNIWVSNQVLHIIRHLHFSDSAGDKKSIRLLNKYASLKTDKNCSIPQELQDAFERYTIILGSCIGQLPEDDATSPLGKAYYEFWNAYNRHRSSSLRSTWRQTWCFPSSYKLSSSLIFSEPVSLYLTSLISPHSFCEFQLYFYCRSLLLLRFSGLFKYFLLLIQFFQWSRYSCLTVKHQFFDTPR